MCEHPSDEEILEYWPIIETSDSLYVAHDDVWKGCSCSDCFDTRKMANGKQLYFWQILPTDIIEEQAEYFKTPRKRHVINWLLADRFEGKIAKGREERFEIEEQIWKARLDKI